MSSKNLVKIMKNRKPLIYFLIILIGAIFLGSFICFIYKKGLKRAEMPTPLQEKTLKEILKDLTAPAKETRPPEEVLKRLSAPKSETEVLEEILKSLTP